MYPRLLADEVHAPRPAGVDRGPSSLRLIRRVAFWWKSDTEDSRWICNPVVGMQGTILRTGSSYVDASC